MPTPAAGSVPTSNRSMRVRGSPKLGHDFCLLQIGILLINRQTAGISIRSLVASSRASSPAARPPAARSVAVWWMLRASAGTPSSPASKQAHLTSSLTFSRSDLDQIMYADSFALGALASFLAFFLRFPPSSPPPLRFLSCPAPGRQSNGGFPCSFS